MSAARRVDLNADIGERGTQEGLDEDLALLEQITSANVACGGHAGGVRIMRVLCARAAANGVRIGAHVGYADREGFGRRELGLAPAEIYDQTAGQLLLLDEAATAEGALVRYVKPHGALYHRCSDDEEASAAIVAAALERPSIGAVLGAEGSALLRAGVAAGLAPIREGFGDRGYAEDGRIVDRREPGAVLASSRAAEQALALATGSPVATVDGRGAVVAVDSICLHSDTPGAVETARRVRVALARAGVAVTAAP